MFEDEWDDYGFEEYDLLTNFSEEKLSKYKEAISKCGDNSLYIDDEAYDNRGRKIEGYYALRTTQNKDRSDFWSIYRSL